MNVKKLYEQAQIPTSNCADELLGHLLVEH